MSDNPESMVDVNEPLHLEISASSGAVLVRATGYLDLDTKTELDDVMGQLGVYGRNVDLDLRGVTFMDSTGITALINIHHSLGAAGQMLTIVGASEPVRRIFELTGVDSVLTVCV